MGWDFSVGSPIAYSSLVRRTMSGSKFCQSSGCGEILQSEFWLTARAIAGCFLAVALFVTLGCSRSEPVQKVTQTVTVEAPTLEPAAKPNEVSRPFTAEPPLLEGSGVTVWADEFHRMLIAGLDGGFYLPYKRTTIERVQRALRGRGLYMGPLNGVLDQPTMKSIYEFQEANANLQRCGVPTPNTRNMLEQGSHTDLTS
jgi:Putative peptidoglycan binding domain